MTLEETERMAVVLEVNKLIPQYAGISARQTYLWFLVNLIANNKPVVSNRMEIIKDIKKNAALWMRVIPYLSPESSAF